MKLPLGCCILGLMTVALCEPQRSGPPPHTQNPDTVSISPNESRERILEWMHEQNLEDTSRLVKLSQELKWELANHDREVLSMATVRKMDEIERLIKRIRARVGK